MKETRYRNGLNANREPVYRDSPKAHTPVPNDDQCLRAASYLSFLLGVIRCGEQLSPDEEVVIRNVITELMDANAPEVPGPCPDATGHP